MEGGVISSRLISFCRHCICSSS